MSRKRTRKRGVRTPKTKGAFGNPKIFRTETWKKPMIDVEFEEKKSFIGKVRDWFKRRNRTIT
jgi:hypothetical protein